MPELLQTYSIEQILIFIVVFAIAVKGCIDFWDWAKKRLGLAFENKEKKEELKKELENLKEKHENDMEELFKIQEVQNKAIEELTQSVHLLITSNKDEIKAWITEKHHYFVYELKYIDDYSLDCVERRYSHYVEEGGNSFVADLMEDIRSLPVVTSPLGPVHNQDKK